MFLSLNFLLLILIFFNYSVKANDIIGSEKTYYSKKSETLIDISRDHNLSFPEVMSSNPHIHDPWLIKENEKITLPNEHIIPFAPKEGLIINLADLRAYYIDKKNNQIHTFPIGIGREGWETPLGLAKVRGKTINPTWTVPKSILEEDPTLPKRIGPGPDNPLGKHAIYLSMPSPGSYLLHGTNKAWGVGMRVSHGCIRLFPEGIKKLFSLVKKGTKVNIVNQPVKAGWKHGVLYIEVHVMHEYGRESNKPLPPKTSLLPDASAIVRAVAGSDVYRVDWGLVIKAVLEAKGQPVAIMLDMYNNASIVNKH